jgi:hypothetical protein
MSAVRLNGRQAIMMHLGIKSAQTWYNYKRKGMPIAYHPGGRCTVLVQDLDDWFKQFKRPMRGHYNWDEGRFSSLAPR